MYTYSTHAVGVDLDKKKWKKGSFIDSFLWNENTRTEVLKGFFRMYVDRIFQFSVNLKETFSEFDFVSSFFMKMKKKINAQ